MCPISRIPKSAQVITSTTGGVSHCRLLTNAKGNVRVQTDKKRDVWRAYDSGTGVCTSRSQRPTVCDSEVTMPKRNVRSRLVKASPWFRIDLTAFISRKMICKGRFLVCGKMRRISPSLASRSLLLSSDCASWNSSISFSKRSCIVLESLALTCFCMAKGNACNEVRMTCILAVPASLRNSAMFRAMERQRSKRSFQIFRPS
mmetsp:Transcript_134553/g.418151  ORF Transcript_134553/g.418151 Transcript_134553/m.418151 type:complete len:202 (-) Transcript_134553:304-909(-)